ncbi:MAG: glycosyltransferase, partial [Elusimicrobiota bacterium]|nr:glycosyltransferase [Elusimicrobiota bacterium]
TDIAEILYASDVFVLTSLWEGLPCTIVEAMCCGKPTVANGIDGVKEIVEEGKTGFLTQVYRYQDTAKRIVDLVVDEKKRIDMGNAAKKSITQEFDLNFVVKAHQDLYNGQ